MSHTCTPDEANALHYLAQSLRPDWKPNKPGITWQRELGMQPGDQMTLQPAHDFQHALRALIHFATRKTTDGSHIMRTPKYFVHDGRHWDETRPTEDKPKHPPCQQHGTDYGDEKTCKACWSEIKSNHRPESHLGKFHDPTPNGVNHPNPQPKVEPLEAPATPDSQPNPTTPPEQDENRATIAPDSWEG